MYNIHNGIQNTSYVFLNLFKRACKLSGRRNNN